MTSPADSADLFRTMARIRSFEEQVGKGFREGSIHGFVHVSLGQEAVAAGVCSALRIDDYITTTHRGHGHCIAKGADPVAMMAELFGRSTGICHGKGGSMHIADPRIGILGANGIVGAGIPLATGAALSAKIRATDQVAVAFFGEGAVHCGAFHEGLVLAATWSLPVIFLCENNGYAEFTRSDRWGGPSIITRASAYGIRAEEVDGSDAVAVNEAALAVVADVRSGGGPVLLEAHTVRLTGHYAGDAQPYRSKEEIDALQALDPLRILGRRLDEKLTEQIETAADQEMEQAVELALAAPYPDDAAVMEDIYA